MKFSLIFAAAPVATASFPALAQHGHKAAGETHAHASLHGGVVRTAGTCHIELVQQAGAV